MSYIGDVSNIPHLVTEYRQITKQQIKRDGRTGVPKVCVTINGRATNIQTDTAFMYWLEYFFLTM